MHHACITPTVPGEEVGDEGQAEQRLGGQPLDLGVQEGGARARQGPPDGQDPVRVEAQERAGVGRDGLEAVEDHFLMVEKARARAEDPGKGKRGGDGLG